MSDIGEWLLSRSNAIIVTMAAAVTVTAVVVAIVLGAHQARDNEHLLRVAVAQNARQAQLTRDQAGVLCDAALGNLTILKALRNLAQQTHLSTAGIPNRLPPRAEAICDRYS